MTRIFILRTEPSAHDPVLLHPVSEILSDGYIVDYSDLTELKEAAEEVDKNISRISGITEKIINK